MRNRLASIRAAKGMTLTAVAELAGTTPQQISRLEKSERRLTTEWMERLSRAFGCRPTELFEDETRTNTKVSRSIEDPFLRQSSKFAPSESEEVILKFWRSMGPEGKELTLQIMEGLARFMAKISA